MTLFSTATVSALKKNQQKFSVILFICLISLTSFIGIYRLSEPPIWHDEALTAQLASKSSTLQVAAAVIPRRMYPPLYFMIVHPSLKIWNNEFGLRFPSVVFGVLSVIAVFLLLRLFYNAWISTIACFFMILSESFFFHLRDGNCYATLLCFSAFSTYFLLKGAQSKRSAYFAFFAVFSVLAIMTHLFAAVYIVVQIIGFYLLQGEFKLKEFYFRNKPFWVVAAGILCFMVVEIWFLYSFGPSDHHEPPKFEHLLDPRLIITETWKIYRSFFFMKASLVLQIAGVYSLIKTRQKISFFLLSLLLLQYIILMSFVLIIFNSAVPRYLILLIIPLTFLTAAGSDFIVKKLIPASSRPLKVIFFAGFIIYVLYSTYSFFRTPRYPAYWSSWRYAGKILDEKAKSKDVIFICANYTQAPLDYYYKGTVPRIGITKWPTPANLEKNVDSNLIGHDRSWLILSHVKSDQPIFKYLLNFKKTFKTTNGKQFQITTTPIYSKLMPDVAMMLFQLKQDEIPENG